ncbi:MAG TPA: PAS domain-containing protein [Pelobium sp.]|nr:PAS domain-containing protein [Pelobium sp.]
MTENPIKTKPEPEAQKNATISIEESLFLMKQAQELASFGNWFWDISTNTVTWSDSLFNIYGLNKNEFKATFEGYQELLHPDDRKRVSEIIRNALQTKKEVIFEERIIRSNGEMRYLKSWGFVKTDDDGHPIKMIGACLDITETKIVEQSLKESEHALKKLVAQQLRHIEIIESQNQKLSEISYIQSHIVRAPLARIMGLVDLLINHPNKSEEKEEIYQYLTDAAREFDAVITDIINKTRS